MTNLRQAGAEILLDDLTGRRGWMSLRKGSEGTVTSVSERKLRNLYVTLRVELCRFVARSVTPVPGLPANDGAGPRALTA